MKKLVCFFVVGIACLSVSLFAQDFGRGGYTGPSVEPIAVRDLLETSPNQYVVLKGVLEVQRVPDTYVLVNRDGDERWSVVVHVDQYAWSNVTVDGETEVLVYGIVLFSDLSIEIHAVRIEIPEEEGA
ncbi:MAG: NirD/YgiW/YdeI family stress tolerance protein [Treponema sp.]|jgi:uncharacterized protein YdeI (BOF family)|nr:NirD/YgiW/YdeI family stress tolerance protein [Treponema sp.]